MAGLAVQLYGPTVRPTPDGLRIVRRLYDVLEIGGLTRDRAGLAALAARVLGIDAAAYTDAHGRRLLDLVHQATVPGSALTEESVAQAGVASEAMRHLAGELSLSVDEQRQLLVELLTPRAREKDQFLAVAMIMNADDVALAQLLAPADVRGAVLDGVRLPHVRSVLERVIDARVEGGMGALSSGGPVVAHGQPAGRFTPDMLADHGPDTDFDTLFALPGVEKLKAFRYLLARQLEGAPPVRGRTPEQLREDALLLRLMREVTHRFASIGGTAMARAVVDTPPMVVAEAMDRAIGRRPAQPAVDTRAFVETLPGHPEPYGVRLREELGKNLASRASRLSERRPENRVPQRLISWDRVNEIVNMAREANNAAFAPYSRLDNPYVGGTGSPDDTIVDIWEYYEPKMQTPEGVRELAKESLHHIIRNLAVNSEHGARLDLDTFANHESQIARDVIDEQLNDMELARNWAEVARNWGGSTLGRQVILVDRWVSRAHVRRRSEESLFNTALHEDVHFREPEGYDAFVRAFARHVNHEVLEEGVPTVLHELSYWQLRADEGRWAQVLTSLGVRTWLVRSYEPMQIDTLRYAAYVNALRLIELVGPTNLMKFYFLMDSDGLASSLTVAMLGSPEAPLSMRAMREAVQRLSSAPPSARRALSVQVFLSPQDAASAEVAGLLRQPGADVLTVNSPAQSSLPASSEPVLSLRGGAGRPDDLDLVSEPSSDGGPGSRPASSQSDLDSEVSGGSHPDDLAAAEVSGWLGSLRLADAAFARRVWSFGSVVRANHPGGVGGALVEGAEFVAGVLGMPPVRVEPVRGDVGGQVDVGLWAVSVRVGVSWAAAWEDLLRGLVKAEAYWRVAAGDRMAWPWSPQTLMSVLAHLAGKPAVVAQWPAWRQGLWGAVFGPDAVRSLERAADEVVRRSRDGRPLGGLRELLGEVEVFASSVEGASSRPAFGWRSGERRFVEVDPDTGVRRGEFEWSSGRWVPRLALSGGAPTPAQVATAMLAGLAALASSAPVGPDSPPRRVAMVVRDRQEGLSRLPESGATDVIVGGFQFQLNTTRPRDNDTNDYVNDLGPVFMLNGVPVDGSHRDPLLEDVAQLDGVNRLAMLGGNRGGYYGELGEGYLPPEMLNVTFSQLYPPLRDMLRTYGFSGLNLVPYMVGHPAFNYSQLIDALRADFGRSFLIALTWDGQIEGTEEQWIPILTGAAGRVDWHILLGWPDRGWQSFVGETGLDPQRVLVVMESSTSYTGNGPPGGAADTEESLSASIGGLVEAVPDILGVVGWEFRDADPVDAPWVWAQRAARALAEGDYLPGDRERERRQQQGRTIAGAVVGAVTAVVIGGALYVYISRARQVTADVAARAAALATRVTAYAETQQRSAWIPRPGDVELVELASRREGADTALVVLQRTVEGLEQAARAAASVTPAPTTRSRVRRLPGFPEVPPPTHMTGGAAGLREQLARTRRDLAHLHRLRGAVAAGVFGVQRWALLKAYVEGELDREVARAAAMERLRTDFPGLAQASDRRVGAVLESVVDHIVNGTNLVTNLDLNASVTLDLDRTLWLPGEGGEESGTRTTVRELLQGGQPGGAFPAEQTQVTVTVWEFMRAAPRVSALLNNWTTRFRRAAWGAAYENSRGDKESGSGYLPALLPKAPEAGSLADGQLYSPEEPWSLPYYMSPVSVFRPGGTAPEYGRAVFHWKKADLLDAVTFREDGVFDNSRHVRWLNNLYWVVAGSDKQVIDLLVGEATGFEQASDLVNALQREHRPPMPSQMIEVFLNRTARWGDVERVVLTWSADEVDGLAQAVRQRDELEAFAAANGFDFEVALHRDDDAPLDLFRHPKAFVTVPGSDAAPATVGGLVRGDVSAPGAVVSASLLTAPEETRASDVVLEVSVPPGVGSIEADGRVTLPRPDWSKVVVRGVVGSLGESRSVAGRLSDYDGESLPRLAASFGPVGPDGVRVGLSGALAGRSWRVVPVDSRDHGVDVVLTATLYRHFGVAVTDAVLVRGVDGDDFGFGVAVEATPGERTLDPGAVAERPDGLAAGVATDLLLGTGVVDGRVAADAGGVIRSAGPRTMPLVALGRRAVASGAADDVWVDAAWAAAVAAMTPVQWFAATQRVWAARDEAIRQVVHAQLGLPRQAQVLADKLVERKRTLPLPRVPLAELRAAGSAPAPEVAGLRVAETPLGWHVSVDGAVPRDIAQAAPAGPGDFRVTVDPVEVAAGEIAEEQLAMVFAGLAPAVAQFTSLDLRPSSGVITREGMAGWAARLSRWAAARGEPVGSYHVNATAAVTAPRTLFDVLPTEFEAFAVGASGDLATPVHPEVAVEFRVSLPGRSESYVSPAGVTPSLERNGYEDGGRLLPGTGRWAAKQLDHGLLVYQPPLPDSPPVTSTELSGITLAGSGGATAGLSRDAARIFVVTATPDAVVDLSGWSKVDERLGANPGASYQSPEGGRYYVKEVASREAATRQRLASWLYNLAGVNAAPVGLGQGAPGLSGGVQTYTRFVPGTRATDRLWDDAAFRGKVRAGFAVHAWLQRNTAAADIVSDGNRDPWLVDLGGALHHLGDRFGVSVPELHSMRAAGGPFEGMSDAEVRESAKLLQPITPAQIDELVAASGTDAAVAAQLIHRRAIILGSTGLAGTREPGPGAVHATPPGDAPLVLVDRSRFITPMAVDLALVGLPDSSASPLVVEAEHRSAADVASEVVAAPAFGPGRPVALTTTNAGVGGVDGAFAAQVARELAGLTGGIETVAGALGRVLPSADGRPVVQPVDGADTRLWTAFIASGPDAAHVTEVSEAADLTPATADWLSIELARARVPQPPSGPDDLTVAERQASIGHDLFGLRGREQTPDFLAGIDLEALRPQQFAAFFDAVAMSSARPWRPAPLSIDALVADPGAVTEATIPDRAWTKREVPGIRSASLPDTLTYPHQVHTIWVGGPLGGRGKMGAFRESVTTWARRVRGWGQVLLWTDVSPEDIELARSSAAPAQGADRWGDIRDMVSWADRTDVRLVSVHELLPLMAPAWLRELFWFELAKNDGPAFAAASDILRKAIMWVFGGIYTDGDNVFTHEFAHYLRQVAASKPGWAAQDTSDSATSRVGNALLIFPPRHPAAEAVLQRLRSNYAMAQRDLYKYVWVEVDGTATRYVEAETATFAARDAAHRYETIVRTGPAVFRALKPMLGLTMLSELPLVKLESLNDQSWIGDPGRGDARPTPTRQQTLLVVKQIVNTLFGQLHNRNGDLYLNLVDPVVRRQPDPAAVWTAVLRHIAADHAFAGRISSVTMTRREGGTATDHVLDLPPEAAALLKLSGGHGQWWLGELSQPALLTPLPPVALPPTSPTSPAATGSHPLRPAPIRWPTPATSRRRTRSATARACCARACRHERGQRACPLGPPPGCRYRPRPRLRSVPPSRSRRRADERHPAPR